MELKLDSLIDKIKNEGIAEGEKKSQELIADAENRAKKIIHEAESKAEHIVANATQESNRLHESVKSALKQAERDLILSLESKLKDHTKKYVSSLVSESLQATQLVEIIKTALSKWNFGSNDNIFIHLSPQDAEKISKEALSGSVSGDVEIKVDPSLTSGFRVSKGPSGVAFDFSSSAISEALFSFLTPNIQGILR